MGRYKGQPKKDWAEAVKSAADKATADRAEPGTYTLETEREEIEDSEAGMAPIRDYIVTLDGPH